MKISLITLSAIVAFAAAATGCTHGAELAAPGGFARIDGDKAYDYRATNAQGVVVAVRSEPNDLRGNVDFWADAVDARLRREGYAPEKPEIVESASGQKGKQLRYTRVDDDRRTYCYWLTVFVTNSRVYLVEAGGDKETFDPARPAIEKTVASFRAD